MNKKLVAFALSTTALLGAGAMAETTPFNGTAANAVYAYETEAQLSTEGMVGDAGYELYVDGTLVIGSGTFEGADLFLLVDSSAGRVSRPISLVFESGATLSGSGEKLLQESTTLKSVSGTLKVSGSMARAFEACTALETFNLSLAAGSNVTDMTSMFEGVYTLSTVDLSGWDVSNVTSMAGLFRSCSNLTTVTLTGWNTSNVAKMGSMFRGCESLESIDLSSWKVNQLSQADVMFKDCTALKSVNLAGWSSEHYPTTIKMFENCSSLTEIDLSGWDSAKLSMYSDMFAGATSISKITLGDVDNVKILDLITSDETWVNQDNRALGSFTLGELVTNWNKDTMAGTWVTASTLPAPAVTPMAVYRLYNPNSGEHFYTLSEVERDATVAAGWNDEGIGWYAPDESDTPVYRLYSGTDHHYTMDEEEKDALIAEGWKYEGVAFYSADPSEGIALLRQFNPFVDPEAATNNSGSHNYTTDQVENDYLVSLGWQAEDVAFYGMAVDADEEPGQPGGQEEDVTPVPPTADE
jgi:surface protein